MSNTIKITLQNAEYNVVFQLASGLSGSSSKVAATRAIELIREAVGPQTKEGVLPESITVDFPRNVLDGLYLGIVEKAKEEKITASDVLQLKAVSTILRMKGRFDKFIDTELANIKSEEEEEFDIETVDEPLDGE